MKHDKLQTEMAIETVKDTFSSELKKQLKLIKISAPIAVLDGTGINDDLNGTERPVKFPVKALDEQSAVVVHSLAKWKRLRLKQLNISEGLGLLTDMRALRPDEDYSPIHSVYVDQWDWEAHISPKERTLEKLKATVTSIYEALKTTEKTIEAEYGIPAVLPEALHFLHAEKLLQQFPDLKPKERENAIAEKYKAVFLMGIGGELSDGKKHDGRAPDYDDWSTINEDGYKGLNGDLLVWHPELKQAFELSSMGIRVNEQALRHQLSEAKQTDREQLYFHRLLLNGELPQSIGGGIGQSRVCMFLLKKRHIGEVQVGIWEEGVISKLESQEIRLL